MFQLCVYVFVEVVVVVVGIVWLRLQVPVMHMYKRK